MSHDEHGFHGVRLADLVLRQQRGIEPARARNSGGLHECLVDEAREHPVVIDLPYPAPMSPGIFGKTVIKRQGRHIEAEIGGALAVGVPAENVGTAAGMSDM